MTGAEALSASLVEASGGHVRAVILYGSQLLRTRPDKHSAYDLVVVVSEYRAFYAGLKASGELHRPVWLMTSMAGVLAPNAIAFAPEDGEAGIAKCQIVSAEDFTRALGASYPQPLRCRTLSRKAHQVKFYVDMSSTLTISAFRPRAWRHIMSISLLLRAHEKHARNSARARFSSPAARGRSCELQGA